MAKIHFIGASGLHGWQTTACGMIGMKACDVANEYNTAENNRFEAQFHDWGGVTCGRCLRNRYGRHLRGDHAWTKPRELRYASSADKSVIELVDELFSKIEVSQGHFFVSDGETFPTREQFFERIRGRLQHGREAVRLMRGFLAKYGELR